MPSRPLIPFLAALLIGLSSVVHARSAGMSEYRGYVTVNRLLLERLFNPGVDFELGRSIGESYDPNTTNLLDLLGTYKTGFGSTEFRNGRPNSLNILIWHLLLSEFSKDIGRICLGKNALTFNAEFVTSVSTICRWPDGPRTEEDLFKFWTLIMDHDAPLSEFTQWETFAMSDEMSQFRGAEAVEWLALSALNNPYFLLRP